ncbi:Pro-Pol poly [Paramuricea clavata]|uniref:Pro-Pol poly n=1 Tax=Paramuricea clavata TaxID=317549 RepID=A0A6S7HPA6_PARCT|nr:Pro-Pol poly [Paramuricea clavata]
MKVLFQELCQSKLGWDEPLSELLYHKWQSWCDELNKVGYIEIPRCYLSNSADGSISYQLHGFCDSSRVCYAAVVYLRVETEVDIRTSLVMSKTRVAPLSQTSIPRLELLSALILARLMAKVMSALQSVIDIDIIKCWTDSITALFWIQGKEKEWKTFVENRVNEIRSLVPVECWSHTPGRDNPADIPSRGAKASQLQTSDTWFHGPSWLVCDEGEWPASKPLSQPSDECNQELKLNRGGLSTTSLANTQVNLTYLLDPKRVSRFHKLLRITAYVLRFINHIQRKPYSTGPPRTAEIKAAEIIWTKEAQRDMDIKQLERQLGLFKDENQVIRCKGRVGNAELPYVTRFPALLPRHHWLTTLIVRYCHERVLHNGLKETLAEVRSKFWITKGRQTVKSVLFKCSVCKRLQGRHYPIPESPDLPSFRVCEEYAFSCVGVDFAGPLYARSWNNGEREMIKTYVALFTCASSRAVHLELVPNLEAKTFMLCLRRFVSRRGLPRLIVSDNAKTFKSAKKTLQRLFDIPEVKNFLVNKGIEWRFNLAKSPWWGGFFERMVKGVKTCLKKVLGKSQLSFDELSTILAEIEAVLNSRPLTYSYSDDIEEAITPAHLIIGRRLLNLPDGVVREENFDGESGKEAVQRRATYVAKKIQHFWQRWKREYLVDIREFHRPKKGNTSTSPVQVGDIVSIRDESQLQRGLWSMGKVERLVTGRDGNVRGARVLRVKNGKRNIIDRPLQKLYPLEIRCANTEEDKVKPARGDEGKIETFERTTPKRAAAVIANDRIGQYFEDE